MEDLATGKVKAFFLRSNASGKLKYRPINGEIHRICGMGSGEVPALGVFRPEDRSRIVHLRVAEHWTVSGKP